MRTPKKFLQINHKIQKKQYNMTTKTDFKTSDISSAFVNQATVYSITFLGQSQPVQIYDDTYIEIISIIHGKKYKLLVKPSFFKDYCIGVVDMPKTTRTAKTRNQTFTPIPGLTLNMLHQIVISNYNTLDTKIDNVEKNLNTRMDKLEEKVDRLEEKVDRLEEIVDANHKQINEKVDKLEEKVDANHKQINEKVDANHKQMNEKVDANHKQINEKVDANHKEVMDALNMVLKKIN